LLDEKESGSFSESERSSRDTVAIEDWLLIRIVTKWKKKEAEELSTVGWMEI
jgi:hypothetical protein